MLRFSPCSAIEQGKNLSCCRIVVTVLGGLAAAPHVTVTGPPISRSILLNIQIIEQKNFQQAQSLLNFFCFLYSMAIEKFEYQLFVCMASLGSACFRV